MEATTMLEAAVYWGTIYTMAYLLYLLVKATSQKGGLEQLSTPYDSNSLILKRSH